MNVGILLKQKMVSVIARGVGIFSPSMANDIRYFSMFQQKLNRKNPKTLSAHIIAKMESFQMKEVSKYVDKYAVRNYVKSVIGETHLLPLIAVFDSPEEVAYDQIPDNSFIKLNQGSRFNIRYSRERRKQVERKVRTWYNCDYYKRASEMQYKDIPKKILVEKMIGTEKIPPMEYSFYTFNGKVEYVQIWLDDYRMFEVDRNYEKLPFKQYPKQIRIQPQKPCFGEMLAMAEKLAVPFPFVRVDFLYDGNQIYFAELTFSPEAGRIFLQPAEYNLIFGDKMIEWDKSIMK